MLELSMVEGAEEVALHADDNVLGVHGESLDAAQSSTMKVLCGSLDLTLQWVEAHLTDSQKNKFQNFVNIFVRLRLCASENDEVQKAWDFCKIAESEKRSRWVAEHPVLSEGSSHKWLMKPMRRAWCLQVALQ